MNRLWRRPISLETVGYALLLAAVLFWLASSCAYLPVTHRSFDQLRASSQKRASEQDGAVDQARADYQQRIAAAEEKHQERLAVVEEEAEDRAMRVLEMALAGSVGLTGVGGVLLDRIRERRRKKRGESTGTPRRAERSRAELEAMLRREPTETVSWSPFEYDLQTGKTSCVDCGDEDVEPQSHDCKSKTDGAWLAWRCPECGRHPEPGQSPEQHTCPKTENP